MTDTPRTDAMWAKGAFTRKGAAVKWAKDLERECDELDKAGVTLARELAHATLDCSVKDRIAIEQLKRAEQAERELAEARKDAERMDQLEQLTWGIVKELMGKGERWSVRFSVLGEHDTLRAAIDAARKKP